ncbi:hypothetical protein C5167_050011 [Papaver somniferum]|uniref:Uncharacterized protein n=1 Tax=Papaver somniferum TaxID=3469 RepID=A0A4Y7KQY4_PAPSO|nr:hypothetical protein C5167_050011 [Papaver somniferum]
MKKDVDGSKQPVKGQATTIASHAPKFVCLRGGKERERQQRLKQKKSCKLIPVKRRNFVIDAYHRAAPQTMFQYMGKIDSKVINGLLTVMVYGDVFELIRCRGYVDT